MKPDGVTMETTETTETAAVAEPSNPQDNSTEQTPTQPEEATGDAARTTDAKVNGKPAAAKPKGATMTKKLPLSKTEAEANARPGVTSRRPVNDPKPSNNVSARTAAVKKPPAPSAKTSGTVGMPRKPVGLPSGGTSTTKHQVKMPEKKPAAAAAMAATLTNGTKPVNGTPKKTLPTTKPKTTAQISRPAGATASKTGLSTSTKPDGTLPSKTSRPATAPPTSRPASKPIASAATTKPSSAKTAASRAATAPSSGRTTAAQPNKSSAPAKKDVSRLPSDAVAKRTALASSAAMKKNDSKSTVNVKPSTSSSTPKVDNKLPPKPPQTTKPVATKKPAVAAARFPAVNRIGQTPPGSPVTKSPAAGTPRSKLAHKPTQAVSPFAANKRPEKMGAAKTAAPSNKAFVASGSEMAEAIAAIEQETQVEAVGASPQGSSPNAAAQSAAISAQSIPLETIQAETDKNNTASLSPQSPVRPASSQMEQQQPSVPFLTVSAEPPVSPAAGASPLPENDVYLVTDQMPSTSKVQSVAENGTSQIVPPSNLNEDDEEEEREGSQLVSVSEMSGTTQPTEESRPGSAGPVGASAWRVGGALLSELDSEDVSVSQQGASELSAPGVLEGTESMDDLGEGSLKGAMDIEGASAGSPDFERVPEIPVNDYDEDEDDDDDNDRVCDMDVESEKTDEPQRLRHDNDVEDDEEEEDEDVEMASEGVTESGLESYGNADEDDFAEDERLDNLNRVVQPPPPPPLLPSAPAAQWDQPNPFTDPWAEPLMQQLPPKQDCQPEQEAEAAAASPLTDPCQADCETPTQASAQAWQELSSATFANDDQEILQPSELVPQTYKEAPAPALEPTHLIATACAPGASPLNIISTETSTPKELPNSSHSEKNVPAQVPGDSSNAPASNPSSSSVSEDEASDTEGEAQLEDSLETPALSNVTFDSQPHGQRCLSTVEEGEEPEDSGAAEDATPPSATSQVSYGFDSVTTASNSNAQSTGESCVKSPGIFSLEELPEEAKEPGLTQLPPAQPCLFEQPYIDCGKQEVESDQASGEKMPSDKAFPPSPEPHQVEQIQPLDDIQAPYYSAFCEKTENSYAGFTALLHPQRRDHSSYPRSYCDIVKPVNAALASPKLSCADLPPRSFGHQPLSPQLRRLEQHQRHLQELEQRREQQSRPLEEAEQERKRREEEEQRRKKDEAEEEIKRNKEEEEMRLREQEEVELKQRRELELQLHQQQEELKQRQQIMQWQQELEESNKGQTLVLSPTSGLCTIYEALENSEDEEDLEAKSEEETINDLNSVKEMRHETCREVDSGCGRITPERDTQTTHSPLPPAEQQQRLGSPTQNGDDSSPCPTVSPDRPPPLDLDWGKKVDIVHQLINQTLLLNGDGCSSVLLLPGGAGGTLSPLESSLWPSLLPPLTPPSATVTSVSSFSPETTGSSPQGDWTVVELETHH